VKVTVAPSGSVASTLNVVLFSGTLGVALDVNSGASSTGSTVTVVVAVLLLPAPSLTTMVITRSVRSSPPSVFS
jgi:hypothetical protein